MEDLNDYDIFAKEMQAKYPLMLSKPYGGFAIGRGWWLIVDRLMSNIQHHIDWSVKNNLWDLENGKEDVRQIIPQVVVAQIKEKFGGLRFYYDGGDDEISGMVRMAEVWASHTCDQCGDFGERRQGGWIRTLCDTHENERQLQMKNYD